MGKTPTYLTAAGAEKLRSELDELTSARRAELARRLRAAIQMGDLSENADYITAKEEQAFVEGRILELEEMLLELYMSRSAIGVVWTDVRLVWGTLRVVFRAEGL